MTRRRIKGVPNRDYAEKKRAFARLLAPLYPVEEQAPLPGTDELLRRLK